jgi:hypothetical protein
MLPSIAAHGSMRAFLVRETYITSEPGSHFSPAWFLHQLVKGIVKLLGIEDFIVNHQVVQNNSCHQWAIVQKPQRDDLIAIHASGCSLSKEAHGG